MQPPARHTCPAGQGGEHWEDGASAAGRVGAALVAPDGACEAAGRVLGEATVAFDGSDVCAGTPWTASATAAPIVICA